MQRKGYETVIINNNPETVSTDFDIADKLYFEPLTPEDVESIVNLEHPDGAVVQFGGQTAIKLTEALMKMGVPILGTSAKDVDAAEDRELFDQILRETKIPRASGGTVFTVEEALKVAQSLVIQFLFVRHTFLAVRVCRLQSTMRILRSILVLSIVMHKSIRFL